jgi:hypothetical protein
VQGEKSPQHRSELNRQSPGNFTAQTLVAPKSVVKLLAADAV